MSQPTGTDHLPLTPDQLQRLADELERRDSLAGRLALSSAEAATWIGVPRSTLNEMALAGQIPAYRVGKRWLFRPGDLATWLADQRYVLRSQRPLDVPLYAIEPVPPPKRGPRPRAARPLTSA